MPITIEATPWERKRRERTDEAGALHPGGFSEDWSLLQDTAFSFSYTVISWSSIGWSERSSPLVSGSAVRSIT